MLRWSGRRIFSSGLLSGKRYMIRNRTRGETIRECSTGNTALRAQLGQRPESFRGWLVRSQLERLAVRLQQPDGPAMKILEERIHVDARNLPRPNGFRMVNVGMRCRQTRQMGNDPAEYRTITSCSFGIASSCLTRFARSGPTASTTRVAAQSKKQSWPVRESRPGASEKIPIGRPLICQLADAESTAPTTRKGRGKGCRIVGHKKSRRRATTRQCESELDQWKSNPAVPHYPGQCREKWDTEHAAQKELPEHDKHLFQQGLGHTARATRATRL